MGRELVLRPGGSGPDEIRPLQSGVVKRGAYLIVLGETPYREAWNLQRALAAAVSQGAIPDTVVLLEHPPTVTLGRRTGEEELHLPEDADAEVVETDRGGRSTYHGPGQLVCYPILDLHRHGKDVKKYCRDLEETVIQALAGFSLEGVAIPDLTGVWVSGDPPRKIASLGVHVTRWVTTHGVALNVDLDPAPFTDWITACGLDGATFTSIARELGRRVAVEEARPHLVAALEEVFGLAFDELAADEGAGLWEQPVHEKMSSMPVGGSPSGEAVGVEQVLAGR
jgi:lipoyl(octanoyl) transferase